MKIPEIPELPTASQTQAQAASGTTRLIWTVNRLRELIQAALPTIGNTDAIAGTSQARRIWNALRVRQAIDARVTLDRIKETSFQR